MISLHHFCHHLALRAGRQVAAKSNSRKLKSYVSLKGAVSANAKRLYLCRCVFNKQARGDLAVAERVDMRPLLLKPAARWLDDAALVTQDDDGVALRDELKRLE